VTMPCKENRCRTQVADAVRRANTTELQYRILLMQSAATATAPHEAKCRMYQAERDLIRVIGSEPGAASQDSKGWQDGRHSY
jgi:hypothetical protein